MRAARFLTEIEVGSDLSELLVIFEQGYVEELRLSLEATVGDRKYFALNDRPSYASAMRRAWCRLP